MGVQRPVCINVPAVDACVGSLLLRDQFDASYFLQFHVARALYQLQLVPCHEARKYVPDNFHLVQLFGYTLGGFYLARYSDSPAGAFDELVALAGLVWNAPLSCAWAARVYVNDRQARDHGLRHVGLPSRLASFAEQQTVVKGLGGAALPGGPDSWWRQPHTPLDKASASHQGLGWGSKHSGPGNLPVVIRNVETARGRGLQLPVCTLRLPAARPDTQWAGPRIKLVLPSFSGGTAEHPRLLFYTCRLATNVRVVAPVRLVLPLTQQDTAGPNAQAAAGRDLHGGAGADGGELLNAVLGGRPVLSLAFDDMEMTVLEPEFLDERTGSDKAGVKPIVA